jgi:hypothetical protein
MINRSNLKKLGGKPTPVPFQSQQILSHQLTSLAESKPHINKLQLSDSNTDVVSSPRWVLYCKADRLTVSRNITLTLTGVVQ